MAKTFGSKKLNYQYNQLNKVDQTYLGIFAIRDGYIPFVVVVSSSRPENRITLTNNVRKRILFFKGIHTCKSLEKGERELLDDETHR